MQRMLRHWACRHTSGVLAVLLLLSLPLDLPLAHDGLHLRAPLIFSNDLGFHHLRFQGWLKDSLDFSCVTFCSSSTLPTLPPTIASSVHPGRKQDMKYPARQYKGVLDYVTEMIDLSRRLHRADLSDYYQDGWETAAIAIYGPLPQRKISASGTGYTPSTATPTKSQDTPAWRRQMLANPWRQIIARDGDWEILSCGHRMYHTEVPGSPDARRRRCHDCGREAAAKKPAVSAAAPLRKTRA